MADSDAPANNKELSLDSIRVGNPELENQDGTGDSGETKIFKMDLTSENIPESSSGFCVDSETNSENNLGDTNQNGNVVGSEVDKVDFNSETDVTEDAELEFADCHTEPMDEKNDSNSSEFCEVDQSVAEITDSKFEVATPLEEKDTSGEEVANQVDELATSVEEITLKEVADAVETTPSVTGFIGVLEMTLPKTEVAPSEIEVTPPSEIEVTPPSEIEVTPPSEIEVAPLSEIEVTPSEIEVTPSKHQVTPTNSEVALTGAEVTKSGAEIPHSGVEITSMGAEFAPSGAEIVPLEFQACHVEEQLPLASVEIASSVAKAAFETGVLSEDVTSTENPADGDLSKDLETLDTSNESFGVTVGSENVEAEETGSEEEEDGSSEEGSDSDEYTDVEENTDAEEEVENPRDKEREEVKSNRKEDGNVEWSSERRHSGDGEEQPEDDDQERKLDDDEDRKNPAYIPRKGAFFEHDLREDDDAETGDGEKASKKLEIKKKKVPTATLR